VGFNMRAVAIALVILLLSLNMVVFDVSFYKNNSNCEDNCGNVIKYFVFLDDLEGDYSEEELIHMKDVRKLILINIFLLITLIGLLIVFVGQRDFLHGGIGALSATLLVLILGLINFSGAFVAFHKIFFWNDFWLLPSDSLLITMFPQEFFYGAMIRIILYSIILSVVSIIGGLIKWKRKK